MGELSELYLSHIGRVEASFYMSAAELSPDFVTNKLNIMPDAQSYRGEVKRNADGQELGRNKTGYWKISSTGRVSSKDINDHFDYLLGILLPNRDSINEIARQSGAEMFFDVLWESSYLFSGTGPIISGQTICGISEFGASINFDIYQI